MVGSPCLAQLVLQNPSRGRGQEKSPMHTRSGGHGVSLWPNSSPLSQPVSLSVLSVLLSSPGGNRATAGSRRLWKLMSGFRGRAATPTSSPSKFPTVAHHTGSSASCQSANPPVSLQSSVQTAGSGSRKTIIEEVNLPEDQSMEVRDGG